MRWVEWSGVEWSGVEGSRLMGLVGVEGTLCPGCGGMGWGRARCNMVGLG